jgi:hypothetical protein
MYSIVFWEKVHVVVHRFIDSYKNSFLKIFTDTWIYYENQIRESYIEWSKKFQRDIYNSIEDHLKKDLIWKKVLENWFSTMILVWNYRLLIEFREDIYEKIRFINNLEIYKK